jgi:hypothetical protein
MWSSLSFRRRGIGPLGGLRVPESFQVLELRPLNPRRLFLRNAGLPVPEVDDFGRGSRQPDHDVSTLIVSPGHEVGCMPAVKVSMMIMRPPQRGQGHANWR